MLAEQTLIQIELACHTDSPAAGDPGYCDALATVSGSTATASAH